ncbi:hypothetical protein D9611_007541 [Ephemerocybe angulata]|uniref:HMG box domain-containing protein n=1 Tax=Ephemerocybe angulata TaxID=980116 RepID=A0A8H5FCM8_9AGAR|nr:hypothetical protein D9611_007541 [Tulosesus angulatus]
MNDHQMGSLPPSCQYPVIYQSTPGQSTSSAQQAPQIQPQGYPVPGYYPYGQGPQFYPAVHPFMPQHAYYPIAPNSYPYTPPQGLGGGQLQAQVNPYPGMSGTYQTPYHYAPNHWQSPSNQGSFQGSGSLPVLPSAVDQRTPQLQAQTNAMIEQWRYQTTGGIAQSAPSDAPSPSNRVELIGGSSSRPDLTLTRNVPASIVDRRLDSPSPVGSHDVNSPAASSGTTLFSPNPSAVSPATTTPSSYTPPPIASSSSGLPADGAGVDPADEVAREIAHLLELCHRKENPRPLCDYQLYQSDYCERKRIETHGSAAPLKKGKNPGGADGKQRMKEASAAWRELPEECSERKAYVDKAARLDKEYRIANPEGYKPFAQGDVPETMQAFQRVLDAMKKSGGRYAELQELLLKTWEIVREKRAFKIVKENFGKAPESQETGKGKKAVKIVTITKTHLTLVGELDLLRSQANSAATSTTRADLKRSRVEEAAAASAPVASGSKRPTKKPRQGRSTFNNAAMQPPPLPAPEAPLQALSDETIEPTVPDGAVVAEENEFSYTADNASSGGDPATPEVGDAALDGDNDTAAPEQEPATVAGDIQTSNTTGDASNPTRSATPAPQEEAQPSVVDDSSRTNDAQACVETDTHSEEFVAQVFQLQGFLALDTQNAFDWSTLLAQNTPLPYEDDEEEFEHPITANLRDIEGIAPIYPGPVEFTGEPFTSAQGQLQVSVQDDARASYRVPVNEAPAPARGSMEEAFDFSEFDDI